MRKFSGRSVLAYLLLAFVFASGAAFGQGGATGTIVGTVTDKTGAVVANARVTITNTGTGTVRVAITTGAGDYTVPDLPPGPYQASAEAPGFSTEQVNNTTLQVAQEVRVNFVLQAGAASETVTVTSGGVTLDTDTSEIAQLVTQKQVDQLPLNGRNFINLLFIGAGAVQTTGEMGQMRQGEGNAISINGARPESNNYTLDGITNTDTALQTPAVILSQDAIQEFKVQSETYSAEYGFSANQVNLISKSGSNQFHGSVFEFNRNDAYDAKSYFQTTIPVLRQNQFGYVLGGPIWIPKLYDGRNKSFFLANYEGWRIVNGSNNYANVPDPNQLTGNFAASGLPAFGSTACTAVLSSGNPCQPIDPNTGQPFPGNVIPAARFSRLAATTLAGGLFPAPNCDPASGACNGSNNFLLRESLPNTTDQQTYRGDQQLGRYGSVFFRWTHATYNNSSISNSSFPAGNNLFTEESTSWVINHTITLPHNFVNNFRFGHLQANALQFANAAPASAVAALGLTGIFTNLPAYASGWPGVSFQNLSGSFGSPGNNPTTSNIPLWEFADSVTVIRGKHTIGFGFDYRRWVQKRDLSTNFLGSYSFNNNLVLTNSQTTVTDPATGQTSSVQTCFTPSGLCGTGNAVADFLLGYYAGASTYQPGPFSSTGGQPGNLNQYHFLYVGPYIQDDWKVTERLTLNLGLRWDYRNVPYEQNNKMFWIDDQNAGGGLCFGDQALLTDGIAPAGNGFYRYCGRRNPRDGSKTPFAPRFGFAYRPEFLGGGDKTVIRGGYGVFFDSSETREIDDSGDLYPFVTRASLNPQIQVPATAPKLTDNLFPAQSALQPVTIANQGSQFIAVIISDHPINPYVQQWQLSVQRELAKNTTLEVSYVGNKGTHNLDRININQPFQPADPTLCQADPTAGDCPVKDRTPFANFSGDTTLNSSWSGYSNYNAGNVKLEHRAADLALVAVYTYAKDMDDKSAAAGVGATNSYNGHLDDHNPKLDYAPSDFNVGQRFVASYVWNLPFGHGKKYLGGVNKAADLAVGGWEVTGIATFQKGFPFSILAADTYSLLSAPNQRANVVGNPYGGPQKHLAQWFNTSAYAQPLAGAFGNSGRNSVTGPGIENFDMGAAKNVRFGERVNFQLRVEGFNVFNHTQFGVDPSSPGVGPGSIPVDNNVNDQAQFGSANTNFGRVVSARPGRVIQLGGKLTF
ncbi:Oar protein [Acidisarcina polymorpha]|uniref:Oar protein n=1 Tax=Acidisarcina polymorpha TaxID=2211140 RepID=A0A2Z5G7J6_9BACT|nr:TonB-dependent receptor [Acidisarcina polymorpha]AXC14950.1 Oar protein [Acidisarcina polymorpha]